jgi:hypothetical protein
MSWSGLVRCGPVRAWSGGGLVVGGLKNTPTNFGHVRTWFPRVTILLRLWLSVGEWNMEYTLTTVCRAYRAVCPAYTWLSASGMAKIWSRIIPFSRTTWRRRGNSGPLFPWWNRAWGKGEYRFPPNWGHWRPFKIQIHAPRHKTNGHTANQKYFILNSYE